MGCLDAVKVSALNQEKPADALLGKAKIQNKFQQMK